MSQFVTFGSLAEGEFFVARGMFCVKEILSLFERPPDIPDKAANAFGFRDRTGQWARFDEATLVQRYNAEIHGTPAEVVSLRERMFT